MKKKERRVRLLYIGRRTVSDKILHGFLYGNQERFWSVAKWCMIGNWYWGVLNKGSISLSRKPEQVEGSEPIDDARIAEWELADLAARQLAKRRRYANRKYNKPEILERLKSLRPALKAMSYSEKKAFVEFIIDYFEEEK